MAKIKPFLRDGVYYFRKRVPRRYSSVEARTIINQCLWTDSLDIADRKAPEVWSRMIDGWEAKLRGETSDAEERMEAAMDLARTRGYRYVRADEVARLPIDEVLKRVESIKRPNGTIDKKEADAALGLVAPPEITPNRAFELFYEVAADKLVGKSQDQLRRHRNPRIKATKEFIEVCGDKPLGEITTSDMFDLRNALMERVLRQEIAADTANKSMTYLNAMWREVARAKGIKLQYENDGLMLRSNAKKKTRPPFSDKWITERLLAPGALDGLNTDARMILLGMINTGYRPSEGAGLDESTIVLEAKTPHIIIKPEPWRSLKNVHSERTIPLTGISLEAFREAKQGFPRYRENSATLSATVNKFLEENGLLETPNHVMYSLRHSFEDRMLRAKIDERIRRDMLGHTLNRERYGDGGGIDYIATLLKNFAL
ncbi:hypothetical protein BMI86_10080 [Thioclava sp. DLFJ5-1]|uniref:tyrosine-type recombinase/integrase n=1 Tax=Thioclava sp. DLFJ5-1 TaxID=1915314 RepID=UPI0009CD35A4|nr:tyrosine-type recombinase/integrase [Thioclava sp. DLFJ5-1]OOY20846.1 hypothetical protein BMI86_10080 [Thioclava sp. DLFJ5-1]